MHERERDERGDELGPWVCSLTVFPPGMSPFMVIAPLEGFYDAGDVEKHPEWSGGWNWPPRIAG